MQKISAKRKSHIPNEKQIVMQLELFTFLPPKKNVIQKLLLLTLTEAPCYYLGISIML